MTKREFLVAVKAIEGISEEMVAKADEMIASLDNRSSKPTKAQVENEGFKAQILEYLVGVEGAVTAAKVAEDTGIVKGKVVALLGQLAKAGKVVAEKGKGKAPMSYKVA